MTHRAPVRGFTLVELLVVISIIGILIALLLPSLQAAREVAIQSVCAQNMHQQGIGVMTYANDNESYLPTYHGGGGHPFVTYWMNQHSQPSLTRVNLGLLLEYVPQSKFYYCPSLEGESASSLSKDGPDNPWNDSLGDSINRLRSSYPARSLQQTHHPGSQGTINWRRDDYNSKVIYSDFVGVDFWNGGGIIQGQIIAPHKAKGYNRLFGDSSVHWINAQPLLEYRAIDSTTPSAVEQHNFYLIMDEI